MFTTPSFILCNRLVHNFYCPKKDKNISYYKYYLRTVSVLIHNLFQLCIFSQILIWMSAFINKFRSFANCVDNEKCFCHDKDFELFIRQQTTNNKDYIEKLCYGLRGSAFRKCISIKPIFLDIKELETKLSNYIYALKIDKIAPSIK